MKKAGQGRVCSTAACGGVATGSLRSLYSLQRPTILLRASPRDPWLRLRVARRAVRGALRVLNPSLQCDGDVTSFRGRLSYIDVRRSSRSDELWVMLAQAPGSGGRPGQVRQSYIRRLGDLKGGVKSPSTWTKVRLNQRRLL